MLDLDGEGLCSASIRVRHASSFETWQTLSQLHDDPDRSLLIARLNPDDAICRAEGDGGKGRRRDCGLKAFAMPDDHFGYFRQLCGQDCNRLPRPGHLHQPDLRSSCQARRIHHGW